MKRRFTAERSNENEWWDDRRAKMGMDGWREGGKKEVAWRAGGEWKNGGRRRKRSRRATG